MVGEPLFRGLDHPMPATAVPFAPGGQLARIYAADIAHGAGQAPGNDFWIDRMLAREELAVASTITTTGCLRVVAPRI